MSVLSALKSRFFPPELCRVAKTGDAAAIAECIARTSLVVVGADLGDSMPFDVDEETLIAAIKAAADKKDFEDEILKLEIDGESFLPIFTDATAAEEFCGAYTSLLGHIHAFRLFTIPGTYLRGWIADGDIIVVNPQNNNEAEIAAIHSPAIRENLPETAGVADARFVSMALPMVGISRPIEFGPES